jgi:hypothetical protein
MFRAPVTYLLLLRILCATVVLFSYLFTLVAPNAVAAPTKDWTNEYASQQYSQWFYPKCEIGKETQSKVNIALINPTFTGAAYHHAFYDFYKKYNYYLSNGLMKNVTNDLNLLTSEVPNATIHHTQNTFIKAIPQRLRSLLPENLNMCILTDQDLQNGRIEYGENATSVLHKYFDIIIIFHEEYVTPKIYYMFKTFVSDGGTLIVGSGNAFYAEVRYNKNNNTVTLVNGHNWAFNNKTAFQGSIERWANESQKWEGSNYYRFALPQYLLHYYNNPFNASGPEMNYVSNRNAKIILDYNSSDLRYPVAAYELKSGKGKVISIGVGTEVMRSPDFLKFFDDLLINYANPKNVSVTHHVSHFYSPPYKPRLSTRNTNGIVFSSFGNQSNDQVRLGSVRNDTTSGMDIFRMIGKTENKNVNFITQPLHFRGDTIKLTIGDVLKYGNSSKYTKYDNPVMLSFNIKGTRSNYVIAFVHGSFWKEGWDQNNDYYTKVNSHTTSSINLNQLLKGKNDTYVEITRFKIALSKFTVINPFDFQININTKRS